MKKSFAKSVSLIMCFSISFFIGLVSLNDIESAKATNGVIFLTENSDGAYVESNFTRSFLNGVTVEVKLHEAEIYVDSHKKVILLKLQQMFICQF